MESEKDRPLTPQEARMVETVLPLVSHCLRVRKIHLSDDQYDEYRSHAYLALCRIVKSHDPSRGAWTTLATTCINNRLKEWVAMARHNVSRHQVRCVWRHMQGSASESESLMARNILSTSSMELITDPLPSESESVEDLALAAYMTHKVQTAAKRMSPRQRQLLEYRLQGDALATIAEKMGVSRQCVHEVNNRVMAIIRKELALEEDQG